MAEKKFISVTEMQHRYGISRRTVYRWIEAGKVPAIKVGSLWRIDVTKLERK